MFEIATETSQAPASNQSIYKKSQEIGENKQKERHFEDSLYILLFILTELR